MTTNIEKSLKQVAVELSMEEFLRKFFNVYYDDAEVLTTLLGYQTENEYWQEQYAKDKANGVVEDYSHEKWLAKRVDKFEIISKAAKEDDFSEVTVKQYKQLRTLVDQAVTKSNDEEAKFETKLFKALNKFFGPSQKNEVMVIKQFAEEEMVAIEPLYIVADTVDGQGDTISLEDTHAMVNSLNECLTKGKVKSNYFHKVDTSDFTITKAWVNPYPCKIGETEVPANLPIAEVKFHNKKAWESRKIGKLQGLSINARAKEEKLQ